MFTLITFVLMSLAAIPGDATLVYEFKASGVSKDSSRVTLGSSSVRIERRRRTFAGPFGNDSVFILAGGLAPHDSVRVEMSLYILGSWDGLDDDDRLCVVVGERDTILNATFSNTYALQSYPQSKGVSTYPRRTGARELDVTGWIFQEPGVFDGPLDARYVISRTIWHSGPDLSLKMFARLKDIRKIPENEAWGIDRISVWAIDKKTVPDPTPLPIVEDEFVPGR